jgi:Cof subfamily protein (haloacid dehalogenase superfamily)
MPRQPEWRPRLVATDLDGTLVRSDRTISARTVAALAAVEEAGAAVVFVTGRPPRWMQEVARETGHRGLAICANGALLYDLHTERVIEEHLIDPNSLRQVIASLRRELPSVAFGVDYGVDFVYDDGYLARWDAEAPGARIVSPEELVARPAAKLLIQHQELDTDTLLEHARKTAGDLATFTHSGYGGLLEVSASGVSKASALARLCEERGIPAEDVLALGDMPNDLPMLAWAGTAYAVANAHPEVLAAVRARTATNNEDGVAQVLERFFPPGRPPA